MDILDITLIVIFLATPVIISHTTTWNLTKLYISLCGPLEDINRRIGLHIAMWLIPACGIG